MLEEVSWKDFLGVLGGGCVAYYGLLLVAGRLRLSSKVNHPSQKLPLVATGGEKGYDTESTEIPGYATEVADPPEATDDLEFSALELLADEVQVIITQSGVSGSTKEELLGQLRKEVARYPTLNKPVFQQAINNLIVKVAQEKCPFTISSEEARECWPK